MIEIVPESSLGFVYGDSSFETLESNSTLEYKLERIEKVNEINVYTLKISKYEVAQHSLDFAEFAEIKCIHGNEFEVLKINRLPQEGWQELIDCWSCHDQEFKSMLELKIKPRKKGVLISHFYLIADNDALPACCKGISKFFYNDVIHKFSNALLIYKFFEDFFFNKNCLVLNYGNEIIEIKLFYKCEIILKSKGIEAFKIGFKKSAKEPDEDSFIGEFFKNLIYDQVKKYQIDVKIMNYRVSFIPCQ